MNRKKSKYISILLSLLIFLPILLINVNAASETLYDALIREDGNRHHGEGIVLINNVDIIKLIPEDTRVTDAVNEQLAEDPGFKNFYNAYVKLGEGKEITWEYVNQQITQPTNFEIQLEITRGSDLVFNWGADSNYIAYGGTLGSLYFNTDTLDYSTIVYDVDDVDSKEPGYETGVDFTDENGTKMKLKASLENKSPEWAGYEKHIDYAGSAYKEDGTEKGTTKAINLKGYTITPNWSNLQEETTFTIGIRFLTQADAGDALGINAIRDINITFNIVDPVTSPLQAPTLTLESDADNGGLKYTVTDNVNNGKASSYGIDLFSDVDCSNKVGNTINVGSNALSGNIPLSTDITEGTTYYAKVKAIGDGTNYSDSSLSTAVSAVASAVTPSKTNVSFSSLIANGSVSETTSVLTLTFDQNITGLTADKIILSEISGINKGTLNEKGNGVYTLSISNITQSGSLKVSIDSIDGYEITPTYKTVDIYYVAPKIDVTWTSATADGEANKTTSTKIDVEFDKAVNGLTKDSFTLSGADITDLSGSGNKYSLSISNVSAEGSQTLSITSPSGYTITPKDKTVELHKVADPINAQLKTVTADGSNTKTTTKLTFTFDQDIPNLSAENIQLSGINDINKGSLIKESGTGIYSLEVSNFTTGGDLTVSVSGVSGYTISGTKTVTIYYYTAPSVSTTPAIENINDQSVLTTDSNAKLTAVVSNSSLYESLSYEWFKASQGDVPEQGIGTSTNVETVDFTYPKDAGDYYYYVKVTGKEKDKAESTSYSNLIHVSISEPTPVEKFTVKYDVNGGTGSYSEQSANVNSTVTISSTAPSKSGYTFTGWKISGTSTIKQPNETITSDTKQTITLTAQWKAIPITAFSYENANSAEVGKEYSSVAPSVTPTTIDGGSYTYSFISKGIKSANINSSTGVITFKADSKGEVEFTIKVEHPNGSSKETTVKINVVLNKFNKPNALTARDVTTANKSITINTSNSGFEYSLKDANGTVIKTVKGNGNALVFDGLRADTEYILVQRAKGDGTSNSDSDWSDDYKLKTAKAEAPVIGTLKAEAKDSSILLSWTVTDDGGASITSATVTYKYKVKENGVDEVKNGTQTFTNLNDAKSVTLTGLTNGTEYYDIQVTINNGKGSQLSNAVKATPKKTESGGNGGGGSFGGGSSSSKNEGWKEEKDGIYYYENGKIVTGFKDIESKTYYFENNGKMVTGFNDIKNKTYYFDAKGVMKKASWFEESKKTYYAYEDGVIAKGWLPIENNWYYMHPTDGHMVKDWVKDEGSWYFMGPEGNMWRQHWAPGNGNWYYVDMDGKMIYNTWIPSHSGYWYYIGSDGSMVTNAMVDGCWINSIGIYHSPTYQG